VNPDRAGAPPTAAPPAPAGAGPAQRLVLRNTAFLVVAQVVATPLALLVNAVAARTLGPDDFGRMYLALTYGSFALLFVEWGQGATLTAMVARERARAGELLGSGLALRALLLVPVLPLLFGACTLLGYADGFPRVLGLVLLALLCATVSNACQDTFRGFERTDFGAKTFVAWQLLTALVVLPTLLLGGRLVAFLVAQAACAGIGALVLLRCLKPMAVPPLRVRSATMHGLFSAGTVFLVFNLILALQTNLDAVFLSKLAPADAVGWNAAARKLTGVLTFPASALISALYPTLCRLFGSDASAYAATARSALRVTLLAAVPVALGCAFFPELGIALFGDRGYGPAADNLRVLAAYLLLVYVSMPLGTSLVAAGRQRAWAAVQFLCVIVSAAFDPLLVPWFQEHAGNGGLGVCVTNVASEVLMVAGGLWLLPHGVLARSLARSALAALAGGVAMAAVALALRPYTAFLVAPLSVLGYACTIWLTGEFGAAQLATLRAMLRGQATLPAATRSGEEVP
jgi:O-antigen/teichoic acid export membrane protein